MIFHVFFCIQFKFIAIYIVIYICNNIYIYVTITICVEICKGQITWYPLVMTNTLRTWSHGPVEIVSFPMRNCAFSGRFPTWMRRFSWPAWDAMGWNSMDWFNEDYMEIINGDYMDMLCTYCIYICVWLYYL